MKDQNTDLVLIQDFSANIFKKYCVVIVITPKFSFIQTDFTTFTIPNVQSIPDSSCHKLSSFKSYFFGCCVSNGFTFLHPKNRSNTASQQFVSDKKFPIGNHGYSKTAFPLTRDKTFPSFSCFKKQVSNCRKTLKKTFRLAKSFSMPKGLEKVKGGNL